MKYIWKKIVFKFYFIFIIAQFSFVLHKFIKINALANRLNFDYSN